MALQYEKADLAYNTDSLRTNGKKYSDIASDLRKSAGDLQDCLSELTKKGTGWTTPAGTAFRKLVNNDWIRNISLYADLLDTLSSILKDAADKYDELTETIDRTHL